MATHCKDYEFLQIEPHWQTFWENNHSFRAENISSKPKYYVLDMFPYPSGAGLHIGHPEGYTATDIIARYKRAKGFNVLHPIGWDAFGLPAEQHAVKTGTHPAANTQNNITNFRRQIKALGFSYDWDREVDTTDPKYFRWTQWIFLQLFKKGLAYVDERPVWWCPELRTVLANEEVVDGKSEVGGFPVERRNLRQWVLRITAYAERLLADLKDVDWPDSTKRMQEAWIGRSEGAELLFELERGVHGSSRAFDNAEPKKETLEKVAQAEAQLAQELGRKPTSEELSEEMNLPVERIKQLMKGAANDSFLKVFTTRPDTVFGVTYMVIAPEHPLVDRLTTPAQKPAVEAYRKKIAGKSDLERTDLAKDKSGVFTGSFAINPANGARIPVWIADYVLMGYGTGAIMAVPAHDERDYDFAVQYQLPVIPVIEPDHDANSSNGHGSPKLPYTGDGKLVHSDGYTGLPWAEAKQKITADLTAKGRGKATVTYKLRDWLFSRQRYWGEPFPIVWVSPADYARAAAGRTDLPAPVSYVGDDGVTHYALPLPEQSLPLTLPEVESYLPSGNGESPLANVTEWLELWFNFATGATVPASQAKPAGEAWIRARRETNTMPQWAGSCWYYLRFLDPQNPNAFASPEALKYWGVPDLYVGGAEHAVLHLLYARFWHKVLFDLGVVPQAEPFTKLFHQGIILGEDGEKMSKSRGNVVSPDTLIASHGTDTLRLYLMFLGPLEAMKPWSMSQIEGVFRFLQKVWRECIGRDSEDINPKIALANDVAEPADFVKLYHETIKKVGDDIEALRFNTAISQMMIFANSLQKAERVNRSTILGFVQLLAPFAPHIAEELWARLSGSATSVQQVAWPQFDPAKLVSTEQKIIVQINGKKRAELLLPVGTTQESALSSAQSHADAAPHLTGKTVKRVIFVPGKILNIVIE